MGILSAYLDNTTSQFGNAFETLNTESYDVQGSVFGTDKTVGDIAMLPLEYSFKINSLRQSWNFSKALGITSSLRDPFSIASYESRRTNAYKAFRYDGLIGDILNDFGKVRFKGKPGDEEGPVRKWFNSQHITQSNIDDMLKDKAPGFLENRILSPDKFHSTMTKINPDYLVNFNGKKEDAYNAFVKKVLYERNNKYASSKLTGYRLENMERIHQSRMKTTKQFLKGDVQNMAEDLIGEEGFGIGGRKRFSLFGRRMDTGRKQTMAAANEALREFVVENAGASHLADGAAVDAMEGYVNDVGRRLGFARKLKGAMWIGGIATTAVPLAAMALRTYMSVPTRLASTVEQFNRSDFGSGSILQNSSVATERQRALMAIRDANLNARSIMGNEAAFMH